jgi:integrase
MTGSRPGLDRLDSGLWRARYRDSSGKQRSATFATVTEAKTWRAQQVAAVPERRDVAPRSGGTVAEAARALAAHRVPRQTRRTGEAWDSVIRTRIESDRLGAIRVTAATEEDCDAWLARLTASGLGAGTRRNAIVILKATFSYAVKRRIVPSSPAEDLPMPESPQKTADALSVAEVEAITAKMPERNRAMVLVSALTGARPSEMLAFRVEDFDLDPLTLNPQVRIASQIEPGTRTRTDRLKTTRSTRTVPLSPLARTAVLDHLAAFPAGADGTVFTTRFGRPYRHDYYGRIFQTAREKAGVRQCVPHDLRRHYTSALDDQGVGPTVLAALLGHRSSALVHSTYARPMGGADQRVREALAAAWKPQTVPGVSQLSHRREARAADQRGNA